MTRRCDLFADGSIDDVEDLILTGDLSHVDCTSLWSKWPTTACEQRVICIRRPVYFIGSDRKCQELFMKKVEKIKKSGHCPDFYYLRFSSFVTSGFFTEKSSMNRNAVRAITAASTAANRACGRKSRSKYTSG